MIKDGMIKDGMIKIGTSGIVVPGVKADFPTEYQSGSRLHYYSALFNTLEINSSFYRIPLPKTFAKWEAEVAPEFAFTVKLWRGITHSDNLLYNPDDLEMFMRSINHIERKCGCILLQFPASIDVTYKDKIAALLAQIQSLNNVGKWRLAIEFRHNSWYQKTLYPVLEKYNVALVFHDMPRSKTPFDYCGCEHIYCRFHGPTGDYKGSYSEQVIEDYAKRIKAWRSAGKVVYAYFNNTMGGALQNAQRLQQLTISPEI